MKQILRNETGAVVIVVILVIILAVGAGGATFLGVRMAIDGGDFLQPFEDLGWISSNEENDDVKDEEIEKEEDDDDEIISLSSNNEVSGVVKSRLSSEAQKSDVDHYYGKMTMADAITEDDELEDGMEELYDLLKLEVNLYVRENKMVEIVFSVHMKEFLESVYDLYKDDFSEYGYENYDDFEDAMVPMFESAFDLGFESALEDSDVSQYINKYIEDGDIQVYITEEGFESLYENYDIDPEEDDINNVIDALEESIGIKISKVN
jgi:hypothetical protein